MPQKFYNHICKSNNFLYLNGKNILQSKLSNIITDFLNEDKNNYIAPWNNLSQYKDIFQYAYSNLFPEIYRSTERRGFTLKSTFHIMFKTYKDKKNIEILGKNPNDYESVRDETHVYEQKPIKIVEFDESKRSKRARWKKKSQKKRGCWKKKLLKKKRKN